MKFLCLENLLILYLILRQMYLSDCDVFTLGMPKRFDMSSSSMVKRFCNLLPTGIR